jgi:uncharacterized protein (TIGR03437 family)
LKRARKTWLVILATFVCCSCVHKEAPRLATVPALRPGVDLDENDARAPWDLPRDRGQRAAIFKARRLAAARLSETKALIGTATPAVSSTTVNPQQWTLIGPQPIHTSNPWAGSVLNLAIDPHNPGTIYAGTFVGKLWKTTNSGAQWVPLSDAGPLVDVQWIAVDPVLQNTVYVLDAGSIFKSADGGTTWTELPPVVSDPTCSGEAFAIHPTVSGTWLVSEYCTASSDSSMIYKTTNAGASWTKEATIAGEINQLQMNVSSPNYAYAAGFASSAVIFQISTDTGTTWAPAIGSGSNVLPQSAQYAPTVVGFASAPTSPRTIYLQVNSYADPNNVTMFKTADGGMTWGALGSFLANKESPRVPGVTAVDPTNPNTVFAGAISLERSTDGGVTWAYANGGSSAPLHSDNHAMVFTPDGNTAFESNDGGVWTSTSFRNSSITWTSLNETFGTSEISAPLGMDPTNANRGFAGLQDNETLIYSGNLAWAATGMIGDGYGAVINPVNRNLVYADTNAGGIFESTASGAAGTFTALPNTPIQAGKIVMDFTTPTTLYAYADADLYQTLDGGNTWPAFGPAGGNDIDGFAVAPSDSNTALVVVSGTTPWVTRNAQSGTAATWSAGFPIKLVDTSTTFRGIVVDPVNTSKFYGFQGNGTAPAPLTVSNDAGMSWQARNLGPNIVDVPTSFLIDPDLPNTFYIGTESAVFRSSDGGATWYPLAAGFPIVNVTSLNLHRAARILRVGTAGRSVWDLAVPTTAPRVTSTSIAANGQGYLLTAHGTNFTSASQIRLNGTALTTTFSSATMLTAQVAASAISPSTVYYLAVNTPGSAGGLSDPLFTSIGPTIYPNGVQNAAGPVSVTSDSSTNSFVPGLPPGTFTAIYGSQLAPALAVAGFPLQTTLNGVQVMVNGVPAPIYYVSPSQIDFVIPWETSGAQVTVSVTSGGATSNTVTAPLEPAPQIFTTNQAGSGQGAVLIAGTATIVAPSGAFPGSRPAAKGEYISIYATGLGAVQNPPTDGAIDTTLAAAVAQPKVQIGCLSSSGIPEFCTAPVQFAGLAPGFVGLYQVNIQIPSTAMSGNTVPLELTFAQGAGRPSNIVTIAVQ